MWKLENYASNMALVEDSGTSLSYVELLNSAEELYQNIEERCLIFTLCTNSIGSILGYVCFINHGIVPVLLNKDLEIGFRDKLFDIYQPSYLWVPKEMAEQFSEYSLKYENSGYILMKMNKKVTYTMHDDLALLLTTSGSTGSPKFVRQSYTNILNNAQAIAEYLELDETERPITTLPMNYTYGLSVINSHLLVGATILVTDKSIFQKEFWTFFKEEGATSFSGVPYTYEMLDRIKFERMELPSLRTLTQAGGKLMPKLHEKFAKYAKDNQKKFVVMYGQCEATARMGYLPSDKALEKCGSMGIAIPNGRFCLKDDNGNDITEPYVTGELVYEGKNVTLGYAQEGSDLMKGDERQGVLYTGDMARFDEEGYYYIVGRKKRFLKIYGNRVNLDEIDCLVKGKFDIECASDGVDDHMYIFITEADVEKNVKNFIVEKTKLNQVAFNIIVINEIPKNDAGKILYQELKKYIVV